MASEKEKICAKYKRKSVVAALSKMFRGKCAYCESKIRHAGYPHIEHFRPKSWALYKDLAVEWTNLLLACEVCNKAKGSKFPDVADGGPIIDPSVEDPQLFLEFTIDVKAKLASVYGTCSRGERTVELLQLNRPALRTHRSKTILRLACLRKLAASDPEAAALWAEVDNDDEYQAFIRLL